MSNTERLVEATRADEGYKPKPYKDTRGLWTFGAGRCLETHPLTGAEWKLLLDRGYLDVAIGVPGADLLERQELAAIEVRLAHDYDFWPQLNDARQNALIGMAYQMGVDKEEAFHQMIAAVREGRWADAEAAGLDSLWAKQTPARAARTMKQLRTGEFPT